MKYTKEKYIKRYTKRRNKFISEVQKDYNIDNTYIYYNSLGKGYQYKIDDIIDLLNFYNEFRGYIYNLKVDDKIKIFYYGSISDVTITKINYRKKLSAKGDKIISSITCKEKLSGGDYAKKIKITGIIYKDIQYEDIFNTCLHFYNYLFFGKYDIELANRILDKIRG